MTDWARPGVTAEHRGDLVAERLPAPPVPARVTESVLCAIAREAFGESGPDDRRRVERVLEAGLRIGYQLVWVDPAGVEP